MLHAFENLHTLEALGIPQEGHVAVSNPIHSDTPLLRRDLAPSLIASIETNYRQRPVHRVFEIGRVFMPNPHAEIPDQPRRLCAVFVDRSKHRDPNAELFYRVKGLASSLLGWLGVTDVDFPAMEQGTCPWAHPTRSASVAAAGTRLGLIAEVHPESLQALKLPVAASILELDLDLLLGLDRQAIKHVPAPKYPGITWDISVVVPESVRVSEVAEVIRRADRKLVKSVDFVAVYRGAPISDGAKSVTFSILFRSDERTLLEEEVEPVHERIVQKLKEDVGGELR